MAKYMNTYKEDDVWVWFEDMMKQNERLSILTYLAGEKAQIRIVSNTLEKALSDLSDEMKKHLETVASDLKPGLEGKTSEQAQTYLTSTMKKPSFKNPIKGV